LGQSRKLLNKGFFVAVGKCLWVFDQSEFGTDEEHVVGGSKVDYVGLVDNEPKTLCEAKSPSVMKKISSSLPPRGIELKWVRGQSLVPKILTKVSTLSPVDYNIGLGRA
jgi:hypothetical protein